MLLHWFYINSIKNVIWLKIIKLILWWTSKVINIKISLTKWIILPTFRILNTFQTCHDIFLNYRRTILNKKLLTISGKIHLNWNILKDNMMLNHIKIMNQVLNCIIQYSYIRNHQYNQMDIHILYVVEDKFF